MKKVSAFVMALMVSFVLVSCSNIDNNAVADLPEADAVYTGEIICSDGPAMIIAGAGERADSLDLYTLSLEALTTSADVLRVGDIVEIGYSGSVLETYPMLFESPVYITLKERATSPLSMYTEFLRKLYESGNGLRDATTYLAFDIDNCLNLNAAERNALIYVLSCNYEKEPLLGSFSELAEQGYINGDELYFPDGVILKITDTAAADGTFTFSASMWRAGSGAIGIDDCIARFSNGAWTYTEGACWIS